ncbi:hypothetical protein [Streptomyces sp. NPDC056387]|uniref:hypothetical protein n=1 Tax=Streptomyces sp. NPDC056387 TaxID=3345803 RepID=UPI0035D8908B
MLQVNPKMLPRLADIEKDPAFRRKRVEEEQWLGEIEGIDLTLIFVAPSRRTQPTELLSPWTSQPPAPSRTDSKIDSTSKSEEPRQSPGFP